MQFGFGPAVFFAIFGAVTALLEGRKVLPNRMRFGFGSG